MSIYRARLRSTSNALTLSVRRTDTFSGPAEIVRSQQLDRADDWAVNSLPCHHADELCQPQHTTTTSLARMAMHSAAKILSLIVHLPVANKDGLVGWLM